METGRKTPTPCTASAGQAQAGHRSRALPGQDFSVCPHNGHCEVARFLLLTDEETEARRS